MTGTRAAPGGRRLSNVSVAVAEPADLVEAELLMRDVLCNDLGGYSPRWHRDLDDLATAYLRSSGSVLLVARDTERLLGTAGVRPCALEGPPNPEWLVREYNRPEVCQLVRVWVGPGARRRGVGRALVERAVRWSVGPGGYSRVYLHTDAGVPGAVQFWRSLPTREVHDSRPDPFNTVHFEMEIGELLRAAR